MLFPVLEHMLKAINEQNEGVELGSGTRWILHGFSKIQLADVELFVKSFNDKKYGKFPKQEIEAYYE